MRISKSKYVSCCQCCKKFWLELNKPELAAIDASVEERFKSGTEVGDLARGLFGSYIDVTVPLTFTDKEGNTVTIPNKTEMVKRTKAEMDKGTSVICEAAFIFDDCYCAVDILRKDGDGYALYEVKSSTDAKDVYDLDISYQKWVLEKCGVKVTGVNLVVLDNTYVLNGELDIQQLFKIIDRSEAVDELYAGVPNMVKQAKAVDAASGEPEIERGNQCSKPYACPFIAYCRKDLPEQGPFDLYRMGSKKAEELIAAGFDTFEKLQRAKINEKQRLQVDCMLNDKSHIDKKGLREFLSRLTYPIYHLDFETIQLPVPAYNGTRPYQQVPTQFSIHIEHSENGPLEHIDFLANANGDPMREVAEALCKAIPMNVCVTAYNDAFEKTRIKEMAEAYPDLKDHLMNIRDHIIDLLPPFQNFCYYLPAMGKSFSIKSVLPALYPDDPSLNYHNLTGTVHNGGEAMNLFPQLREMSGKELEKARKDLLDYCCLDTYAMVCVLKKIRAAAK